MLLILCELLECWIMPIPGSVLIIATPIRTVDYAGCEIISTYLRTITALSARSHRSYSRTFRNSQSWVAVQKITKDCNRMPPLLRHCRWIILVRHSVALKIDPWLKLLNSRSDISGAFVLWTPHITHSYLVHVSTSLFLALSLLHIHYLVS